MRRRISLQQNLINHVGFVLDASASMGGKERDLIAVADDLIDFLKEKSQSYNQETRVTMYIFGQDTQAACYDIDVLRTPSIRNLYEATGPRTALIDATMRAIVDMKQTATLYGDHAFLLYVLTDGQENASKQYPDTLAYEINHLPVEWTVAALVPDRMGQNAATRYGFSIENTMIWDATSARGVQEVGTRIREATDTYMQARAAGIRGTTSLFTLTTQNLTPQTVSRSLTELPESSYTIFDVTPTNLVIRDAVEEATRRPYRRGSTFYQLVKTETIQPQKQLAVKDKTTNKVYTGQQVRQLLGLPESGYAKVAPASADTYDIFVQSTSPNRKLVPFTKAIVLN